MIYKTALITGGSNGIGVPTLDCLLRTHHRVFCLVRNVAKMRRVLARLAADAPDGDAFERRCVIVECDLADLSTVWAAAERVERDLNGKGL